MSSKHLINSTLRIIIILYSETHIFQEIPTKKKMKKNIGFVTENHFIMLWCAYFQ